MAFAASAAPGILRLGTAGPSNASPAFRRAGAERGAAAIAPAPTATPRRSKGGALSSAGPRGCGSAAVASHQVGVARAAAARRNPSRTLASRRRIVVATRGGGGGGASPLPKASAPDAATADADSGVGAETPCSENNNSQGGCAMANATVGTQTESLWLPGDSIAAGRDYRHPVRLISDGDMLQSTTTSRSNSVCVPSEYNHSMSLDPSTWPEITTPNLHQLRGMMDPASFSWPPSPPRSPTQGARRSSKEGVENRLVSSRRSSAADPRLPDKSMMSSISPMPSTVRWGRRPTPVETVIEEDASIIKDALSNCDPVSSGVLSPVRLSSEPRIASGGDDAESIEGFRRTIRMLEDKLTATTAECEGFRELCENVRNRAHELYTAAALEDCSGGQLQDVADTCSSVDSGSNAAKALSQVRVGLGEIQAVLALATVAPPMRDSFASFAGDHAPQQTQGSSKASDKSLVAAEDRIEASQGVTAAPTAPVTARLVLGEKDEKDVSNVARTPLASAAHRPMDQEHRTLPTGTSAAPARGRDLFGGTAPSPYRAMLPSQATVRVVPPPQPPAAGVGSDANLQPQPAIPLSLSSPPWTPQTPQGTPQTPRILVPPAHGCPYSLGAKLPTATSSAVHSPRTPRRSLPAQAVPHCRVDLWLPNASVFGKSCEGSLTHGPSRTARIHSSSLPPSPVQSPLVPSYGPGLWNASGIPLAAAPAAVDTVRGVSFCHQGRARSCSPMTIRRQRFRRYWVLESEEYFVESGPSAVTTMS